MFFCHCLGSLRLRTYEEFKKPSSISLSPSVPRSNTAAQAVLDYVPFSNYWGSVDGVQKWHDGEAPIIDSLEDDGHFTQITFLGLPNKPLGIANPIRNIFSHCIRVLSCRICRVHSREAANCWEPKEKALTQITFALR